MKIKRAIAEILALVLFINTLSITTLAENEAQTFVEVMEQEHIEPVVDQWGEGGQMASSDEGGFWSEEGPADVATGSVFDQWGEEGAAEIIPGNGEIVAEEVLQEEFVAVEAVEGELVKEDAEERFPVNVLGADGDYEVGDAAGFRAALEAAYGRASTTISLNSDISLGDMSSPVSVACSQGNDATIFIDLNGHRLSGKATGELLNIHSGTVTFTDTTTEKKGSIVNESSSGNVINVSSDGPVVILKAGHFESQGSVIKVYGGTLKVEADKYPYVMSGTADAVFQNDKTVRSVELAGGVFSTDPGDIMCKQPTEGHPGYKAYYVEKYDYYVVRENHKIYLRGLANESDKGFDTIEDAVSYITEKRQPGDMNTIFLVDDYVGTNNTITAPAGLTITFDLYGNELTGIDQVIVGTGATLILDDSLVGGYFEIIKRPDYGKGILKINGGSYNVDKTQIPLETFIGTFLDSNHSAVESTHGGVSCYTVTMKSDRILVVNKGSVDSFETAFELAGATDEIRLIGDFSKYQDAEGKTVDGRLKKEITIVDKTLVINLNGHTVEADQDQLMYTFALYGANVTIKDDNSNVNSHGVIRNLHPMGQAVFLQDDSTLTLSNVSIEAENYGLAVDSASRNTVNATNTIIRANVYGLGINGEGTQASITGSDSTISSLTVDTRTGTFNAGKVLISAGAGLEIAGGTYSSELQITNHGDCCISGGTFEDWIGFKDCINEIDITGGLFKQQFYVLTWRDDASVAFNLKGGYFSGYTFKWLCDQNTKSSFSEETVKEMQAAFYVYGGYYQYNDAEHSNMEYYLAPGYFKKPITVTEGGITYKYTTTIGSQLIGDNVVIGDGLYIKASIVKNPTLKKADGTDAITDQDIAIQITEYVESIVEGKKIITPEVTYYPSEQLTPVGDGTYTARLLFYPQSMTNDILIQPRVKNNIDNIQADRKGEFGPMLNENKTSIRKYANVIHSLYADDEKLTGVLSAMLHFGSAAQVIKGYKLDDLADDAKEASWIVSQKDEPAEMHLVKDGVFVKTVSLQLEEKHKILLTVQKPTEGGTYRVLISSEGSETIIDGENWDKLTDTVEIVGIKTMDTNANYNVKLQKKTGDVWEDVSGVSTVSVDRYVYDYTHGSSPDPEYKAIDLAIYRFGLYAREYGK